MSQPSFFATVRRSAAAAGRPLEALRWRRLRARGGVEPAAMALRTVARGHAAILRAGGARVGRDCAIDGPLHLVNAAGSFANLRVGDRVRLGKDVTIDLAEAVQIGDGATLAPRVTLLTGPTIGPGSPGDRPAPASGPVSIGAGAYLGPAATVLPGVTVGAGAMVEATAVVTHDLPPGGARSGPDATALDGGR